MSATRRNLILGAAALLVAPPAALVTTDFYRYKATVRPPSWSMTKVSELWELPEWSVIKSWNAFDDDIVHLSWDAPDDDTAHLLLLTVWYDGGVAINPIIKSHPVHRHGGFTRVI
jgi:hypothetical protein